MVNKILFLYEEHPNLRILYGINAIERGFETRHIERSSLNLLPRLVEENPETVHVFAYACNRECYRKTVGNRLEKLTNLGIAVLKTEACDLDYEFQCRKTSDINEFGNLIDEVARKVLERMEKLD